MKRLRGKERFDALLGFLGGENAVGRVAGLFILRAVVNGRIVEGAHGEIETIPFRAGEVSDGCLPEGAAEVLPGGAKACGGGIEGLRAAEKGCVKDLGGASLRAIGAKVEAAHAAIGGEGNPEWLVRLGRAEGGPFLIEPFANGEFVFDGVFAAAGGVKKPFVGIFDAQPGIGGSLGEEIVRGWMGTGRAGDQQKEKPPQMFHAVSVACVPRKRQIVLENTGIHVIITNMKKSNNDGEAVAARLSLSLPNGLAEALDRMVEEKGAASRSALVADLVRAEVVEHRSRRGKQEIAGTITLVYDHHARNLQAKLTDIQHDCERLIVSVMHVHLNHHNCLEVLVVRGAADKVRVLADRLGAVRGVKHGRLTITTTGKED